MTDLLSDLKNKFSRGNIAIQFIYINTALFIITALIQLVLYLFNYNFNIVKYITSLPATLNLLGERPWSIITYMFMHDGLIHLFFNMLLLYWFGQFFLNFFSAKHLRGLYFLGGILGGLFFILAYQVFPIFRNQVSGASLIGASASVLAIVIAIAYKKPNHSIRLLLVGSIKLKYLALFVVITDLLTITSNNSGGHIAHLGGAFAGYLFALSLSKGIDLTQWINSVLDIPINIKQSYKKRRQRRKDKKMKVAYKNKQTKRAQDYNYNEQKKSSEAEIDHILDKIKESGYNNLSEEEKRKLFEAGR